MDNNTIIKKHLLTTVDNPYNPFTQFDEWLAFDVSKGYNTINYLARIAMLSNDLSEEDELLAQEQAIEEIISFNHLGLYIKVTEDDFVDRTKTSGK